MVQLEDTVTLSLSLAELPEAASANGVRIGVRGRLPNSENFAEIGQTETITGETCPVFTRTVPLIFRLDLNQELQFVLYMIGNNGTLQVGECTVRLRTIASSVSPVLLPLNNMAEGTSASENLWELDESPLLGVAITDCHNGTLFEFQGNNFQSPKVINLASYFTVSLIHNSPTRFPHLLYRSELISNASDQRYRWKPFIIPTKYLSSPTLLEFCCYAFIHNSKTDVCLGRFTVSYSQLISGSSTKFMLRLEHPEHKKSEQTFMELVRIDRKLEIPTFLSAMKTGTKLHFTAAVDFTARNGGPTNPDSLHFVHPNVRPPYAQALYGICNSVCSYDPKGRVSLLGFGANTQSRVFSLNGKPENPYVRGVEEAMACYRKSVMSVAHFAPTNYAPVIHEVIKLAKAASRRSDAPYYFTLIILTNGFIKDIEDTVDTIVDASALPISIIFVGISNLAHPVGGGDHTLLTRLIDPTLKSTATNFPLKRQCISFIDYRQDREDSSIVRDMLSVIPLQMTQWLLQKSDAS